MLTCPVSSVQCPVSSVQCPSASVDKIVTLFFYLFVDRFSLILNHSFRISYKRSFKREPVNSVEVNSALVKSVDGFVQRR